MIDNPAIIDAWVLDGSGGRRPLTDLSGTAPQPGGGIAWLHFDRNAADASRAVMESLGIEEVYIDALLAEETQPRAVAARNGLLVILRGVNTNPGSNPEDMVSLRLWLQENRIISVRSRPLGSVQDIRERLDAGNGPRSTGDFLVAVADRLVERMGPVIDGLSESLDHLEDSLETLSPRAAREDLRTVRQQAIILRRYLAPQRDVLGRLQMEDQPWLGADQKITLREVAAATTRYVEELDAVRERAGVAHDELMALAGEAMNRTMYTLTLVATIVLPVSMVTGLLGMNVGGIPLAETAAGFWWVSGGLVAAALGLILLFRHLRWFR